MDAAEPSFALRSSRAGAALHREGGERGHAEPSEGGKGRDVGCRNGVSLFVSRVASSGDNPHVGIAGVTLHKPRPL